MRVYDIDNQNNQKFVEQFEDKPSFRQAFYEEFEFIRAYHRTRLCDSEIERVREQGLLKTSKELLIQKAKSRFVDSTKDRELAVLVQQAILEYYQGNELNTQGELNFGLIREALVNDCYQYLFYGSEVMLHLADHLRDKFGLPFRTFMSEYGASCLITALVPVSETSPTWIDNIYEYLLEGCHEASLVRKQNLPPSHIIKIEKLPTPINRFGMG